MLNMLITPAYSQTSFDEQMKSNESNIAGGTVALRYEFSGNVQDLEERCVSLMEKTLTKSAHALPIYVCKVCGKEGTNSDMKHHIEANHLEGVHPPCNFF